LSYFHYTSLEGIKGIIENKVMWASHINFLNDKKEWHHFDSVLNIAIKELDLPFYIADSVYESHEEILNDLAPFHQGIINELNFILSFSTVADCKSQWMEYCPKFQGYALEFSEFPVLESSERKSKGFDAGFDGVEPSKCIYDQREQIEKIKSILKTDYKKDVYYKNKASELLAGLKYQFKHPGFAEEKEHRWYGRSDSKMDIRVKNGLMIPYVKVPIDITKLSAIWVGPSSVQEKAVQGLGFWWSILQQHDSSYIFKNKLTGNFSIHKSEIPYSFL
jgi:hypothetical protein